MYGLVSIVFSVPSLFTVFIPAMISFLSSPEIYSAIGLCLSFAFTASTPSIELVKGMHRSIIIASVIYTCSNRIVFPTLVHRLYERFSPRDEPALMIPINNPLFDVQYRTGVVCIATLIKDNPNGIKRQEIPPNKNKLLTKHKQLSAKHTIMDPAKHPYLCPYFPIILEAIGLHKQYAVAMIAWMIFMRIELKL